MTFVSRLFSSSRNHNRSNSLGQLVSHSFSHSLWYSCTHSAIHSFIQLVVSANTRSAAAITIENDSIKLPVPPGKQIQLPACSSNYASCLMPHTPCCMPQSVSTTIQSNFCAFSVLRIFAFSAPKLVANMLRVLHATTQARPYILTFPSVSPSLFCSLLP